MLGIVYNTLIYVAAPFALGVNLWKGLRDPAYRDRVGERLGLGPRDIEPAGVWIHAVSVGEVQAAAVLIRKLLQLYPERRIVVTTGTPTGAERVRSLFGERVRHVYLPYDLPGAVRRFLDRVRPRIAIVMETEVWPNLFRESARRDIPIVIASARLSQKSVRGYRRLASLFKSALAQNIHIAAQTPTDADRFVAIGANPRATSVTGNIKFDIEIADAIKAQGRALRAQFGDRPVWVAGSTHAVEEDDVLAAHERLLRTHPRALLVLAPRHPQRFDEIRAALRTKKIAFVMRSSGAMPSSSTTVLLLDTLGELVTLYAAADVAFVGGSLVPIGGHNLLEPAALGMPVITGPHTHNAPDIARALLACGAAIEVSTREQLSQVLAELFSDVQHRRALGARALEFVAANRGALQRLLALIEPALR